MDYIFSKLLFGRNYLTELKYKSNFVNEVAFVFI